MYIGFSLTNLSILILVKILIWLIYCPFIEIIKTLLWKWKTSFVNKKLENKTFKENQIQETVWNRKCSCARSSRIFKIFKFSSGLGEAKHQFSCGQARREGGLSKKVYKKFSRKSSRAWKFTLRPWLWVIGYWFLEFVIVARKLKK